LRHSFNIFGVELSLTEVSVGIIELIMIDTGCYIKQQRTVRVSTFFGKKCYIGDDDDDDWAIGIAFTPLSILA
jgi:hypothetical protein